jgi:uncharacterized protein (DUF1778 family)
MVPAHLERTVRINITARESQIEKIDRWAQRAGLTRSAYVVQAAMKRDVEFRAKPKRHTRRKKLKEAGA